MFMPGCFFLKMEKFLPQRGRFEVNWDMMFIEHPRRGWPL